MPRPRTIPAGVELEQPEQHAEADSAGEKRQVGRRQVALDESDQRRRRARRRRARRRSAGCRRAPAPSTARAAAVGAALDRFEIHAARIRILRQLAQRPAVHLATGDDDRRGLSPAPRGGRVVDLRPDVAFGVRKRARGRADTTRRSPRFQRQGGIQLQQSSPRCTRCTENRASAIPLLQRCDARAGHRCVLDRGRRACRSEPRQRTAPSLPPESCLFERLRLAS